MRVLYVLYSIQPYIKIAVIAIVPSDILDCSDITGQHTE